MKSDSIIQEHFAELEKTVEEQLPILRPIDSCWQPTDVLPDLTDPNWQEQVEELREGAKHLPGELLVALVDDDVVVQRPRAAL